MVATTKPTIASEYYFKVSAGLKKIIGRDLITNDLIAIFELVKNSFDAHAKRVDIVFEDDAIWIIDNGKGMSKGDITNKWLFVAYSAKADGTEDSKLDDDYRSRRSTKGVFAGNKGVGRFSCDRLGEHLLMQTRSPIGTEKVERLYVDWSHFEVSSKNEFVQVPVELSRANDFFLPQGIAQFTYGTVLKISGLREPWTHEKLTDLRAHLAKLVSPLDYSPKSFSIHLYSQYYEGEDDKLRKRIAKENNEAKRSVLQRKIVNQKIGNFIFQEMKTKTTYLEVSLKKKGTVLHTKLMDRGQLIYEIEERNDYDELRDSNFSCQLYYLNQAAKTTFAKRMGVPSVKFGSVFLFRNDFRVFPIGEEGVDTFGIDRRKQQGYARYLGSRDLIGRIDVHGPEEKFRESSSRDHGLVETAAYKELEACFWKKCLRRLERYVVGVTWKDPLDKTREDIKGLMKDEARARVIDVVSELTQADDLTLIAFNHHLIDILNDKSDDFPASLDQLRLIAKKADSKELEDKIKKAANRYKLFKSVAEQATRDADKERSARIVAEKVARQALDDVGKEQSRASKAETAYEEEKKRSLFLTAVSSPSHENLVNLHHQIGIYAADVNSYISQLFDKYKKGNVSREEALNLLGEVGFKMQKIIAVSRFATKANFRLDSEQINGDLASYIEEYVPQICQAYNGDGMKLEVKSNGPRILRKFRPMELSILLDNLVHNAKKAKASHVIFNLLSDKGVLEISVSDNGKGLTKDIPTPERIFEKGFTTTNGSGLGLYHAKQIVEGLGGTIELGNVSNIGATFVIRIPR